MKSKKIPLRICIISGERLPKYELLRIVLTPDNNIVIDDTGKVNGHGAYIKKDKEIIEKLWKSKKLNKIFEREVESSVYEELKARIN